MTVFSIYRAHSHFPGSQTKISDWFWERACWMRSVPLAFPNRIWERENLGTRIWEREMISLIELLRNIVDDKHKSKDDKGAYITLKEKKQSKCKPFKLRKGRTKTLTLEIDIEGFDAHPLLKQAVKNLKKYPDYIIFCENTHISRNILYILVVELKSDNSDDWHRQAKAGITLAQYLVGMLENYQKMTFPNVEYRCLLFHTKKETAGMRKKSNISSKSFEYEEHEIFHYQFTDKPCNVSKPYELEMFLR